MTRLTLLVLVAIASCSISAGAAEESLVSVDSPRGVTQKFIVIKPANPVAAVILFAGGHGGLGLTGRDSMNWGNNNFLVRTRRDFAAKGFLVAVVDAPSDRSRMNAIFRMSNAHAKDISAVAAYLRKQSNVPVWLIGTSMGTFSAAAGAIKARGIDGLVLTSTVTRSRRRWHIAASHPNGVASMNLGKITAPVLVMSHKDDQCELTPAADAPKLARKLARSERVETLVLAGGRRPQSPPCEARSQHGFYGIERRAVGGIAKFIRASRP